MNKIYTLLIFISFDIQFELWDFFFVVIYIFWLTIFNCNIFPDFDVILGGLWKKIDLHIEFKWFFDILHIQYYMWISFQWIPYSSLIVVLENMVLETNYVFWYYTRTTFGEIVWQDWLSSIWNLHITKANNNRIQINF